MIRPDMLGGTILVFYRNSGYLPVRIRTACQVFISVCVLNRCFSVLLKFTLEQAVKTQTGSRGIGVLFKLTATWGLGGQRRTLAALLPEKRPCTSCTGGWVGPPGRSRRARKISTSPGFDPRTIQREVRTPCFPSSVTDDT